MALKTHKNGGEWIIWGHQIQSFSAHVDFIHGFQQCSVVETEAPGDVRGEEITYFKCLSVFVFLKHIKNIPPVGLYFTGRHIYIALINLFQEP